LTLSDAGFSHPDSTGPARTPANWVTLHLRSRVELFKGSGVWDEIVIEKAFPITQTAVLLCDVWDDHWCSAAARRVDALAPRIDAVIRRARAKGIQIVHAPSDTMSFYADFLQRKRILDAPAIAPPAPRDLPSPPLPIDDSDGGCDSTESVPYRAWKRQHPAIEIGNEDVISDNGREIYSFLAHRGIENLIVMGVHTNMCVLNRSFAIKQMTKWGMRCLLVRDLTDAMYNPSRAPFVNHDEGTNLVVEYIEKYWCPSIISQELL